jgi:uncharacterized protein
MSDTLDRFSRLAALKPARPAPLRHANLRQSMEDDSLAQLLGASVATNRYGEHLVARNWYSTPEFTAPFPSALELLSRTGDESLSRRTRAALEDPAKWLFLDTETTGLAGGTGTYAFLVGLAWWDAGGLQVEQFFMRDFGEEHSLLLELAARIAARPVLVTFNGKSFDWPLLESRFTMTRAIATPRLAAHLDLLHPARALWKLRLGSVRLVDLERHVLGAERLGWQRDDDVPSALIPQFYFDFLRGGSPAPLLGVVRHNQLDLRGLAALFGKINSFLGQDDLMSGAIDSVDLFGLSRFLHRKGESGRAHIACAHALDLGLPAEFSPRARRDLALLSKRRGDHEQAAALWHEIAADPCDGVLACEQLAIHYERRIKDHSRATEFAKIALAKVRLNRPKAREPFVASSSASQESRLLHRLERLARKLALSGNTPNAALLSAAGRPSATCGKRRK